jgi:hypothetical protein
MVKRAVLIAAALVWASFASFGLLAQEADTEASDTATAEAASDEDAESSEVFIPTEEISEDFAVSFPVDI